MAGLGHRRPGRSRRLCTGFALSLAVLAMIEGLCSSSLVVYDLAVHRQPVPAEQAHALYDPELGWVNRKSIRVPDLYSVGSSLSTNSMGLRGTREYAPSVPSGRLRVVCSGDSFTLGYGVDDAQAWPAALESQDVRLECPNMGQGGYGVDQAWLWYRRDGLELQHQVHLFAFIDEDFRRLRRPHFMGYPKPLLALGLGGDSPHPYVSNAPLPKTWLRRSWWTTRAEVLEDLRIVALGKRVHRNLLGPAPPPLEMCEDDALGIVRAIFVDLERSHTERQSRLLLLHLPRRIRNAPDGLSALEPWALRACREAEARGVGFLDLRGDFAAIPIADREALFIAAGEIEFPGAAGHYSARGNAFVAKRLLAHLRALPEYEALEDRPR